MTVCEEGLDGLEIEVLNFWNDHRALINALQTENGTHSPGKSVNIRTCTNEALYKNAAEWIFALAAVF